MLRSRSGFQTLTVPSQEEEAKVVLEMRFQAQEKASRECSEKVAMGKLGSSVVSKRRRAPSPLEVRIWVECDSE
jgi:hypothetical protein